MEEKQFICEECGYIAQSIAALGGHQSHCIPHLKNKGTLQLREEVDRNNKEKSSVTRQNNKEEKEKIQLELFIKSRHKCERCGKIMTEKYGSGRFCSKGCANTRNHSAETKEKMSKASKQAYENGAYPHIGIGRHESSVLAYNETPKFCVVCEKPIPYERRENDTCCAECQSSLRGKIMSDVAASKGGNSNPHGAKASRWGVYHGIRCDSSWELAFVIYCFEHGKPIERNNDFFLYTYNGKQHKYFPDFIVNDDYVEIKGLYTEEVQDKIKCFPKDKTLIMIDGSNIGTYLSYCEEKYGKDFASEMYDKDKPSWNNHN